MTMSSKTHNGMAAKPQGMWPVRFIASCARRVERFVIGLFVRSRFFNPWFPTPAGIAFVETMYAILRNVRWHSAATRRAAFRFFVTQPVFSIPFKRWRFKKRHGFSPPSMIALSPTQRCNLSCPGCFGGGQGSHELSLDRVSRLVSEACDMGVYLFVLIGGEPFCWPHLFDLLERHPATMFGIYTNGLLVTREIADRLAALGNGQLGFSIEGFEKETDQRRGSGVFNRVLDAMAHCRAAGVHFAYSVTVTRANNDLVVSDEFVDFFIGRGCTDGWYYQYMPVGCAPDASLLPTAAQREHRRRRVDELRRTRAINLYDFLNDGPLVGGCMCAGRIYLHINADGAVEPCVFYPFAADTILDKTLLAALKSPFFKAVRQRQTLSRNWLVPCPVVDHPALLRDAVAAGNAQPTQPTAPLLLDGLAGPLEAHAAAYRAIADATWDREFPSPAYPRRTTPPPA